jgi:DNA-binding IscR family transcriptional regulator
VCSRESSANHICPTKLLWTRVRFSIISTLRETTLADLLVGAGGSLIPSPTLASLDMNL